MTSRASRRGWWLPAVAAAAVVGLALGATALSGGAGTGPASRTAPTSAGGWEPMAASPLAARLAPVMQGWGDQVVVVGGRIEPPCPPSAGCVREAGAVQRDGALYDVPTDTWERLPDAPVPLDVSASAVLDDVLYVWLPGAGRATVLALDLASRTWSQLPAPPGLDGYVHLTAAGDRVIAYAGDHTVGIAPDLAWLPSEQNWEQLPAAPYPASYDRAMTWTDHGLVLVTAAEVAAHGSDRGPPFMRAAVLDGSSWRRLPPQETVIGGSLEWSWTGDRVVSAYTATADGGETDPFDRAYPSGGYLDPSTGRWSELPATPEGHQRRSGLPYAAGGRWVANGEGLVLDAAQDRWLVPPDRPDAPDQDASAAWAAGRLVVWGGAADMAVHPSDPPARLLATGAVWTPPQG